MEWKKNNPVFMTIKTLIVYSFGIQLAHTSVASMFNIQIWIYFSLCKLLTYHWTDTIVQVCTEKHLTDVFFFVAVALENERNGMFSPWLTNSDHL